MEGRKYTNDLQQQIESGEARFNGDVAIETLATLFDEIQHADREKADDLWGELVVFWKAQTASDRARAFTLEDYLEFRVVAATCEL